jgi:hypothetical protein
MICRVHALPLPSEPWQIRCQPLPAGVRFIGKTVTQILNRYRLSFDELHECQPQLPTNMFVSIVPQSNLALEPMAEVSSQSTCLSGIVGST